MKMSRRSLALVPLLALLPSTSGCSVGDGTGDVESASLFAHDCWGTPVDAGIAQGGPYDMRPNYFGASPYLSTLFITVQNGSDQSEYSDGLNVLIDDVDTIRAAIAAQGGADGGTPEGGVIDGGDPDGGDPDAGLPAADEGYVCAPSAGPTSFWVAINAGAMAPGAPAQPPACLIANPSIVHMSLYLNRTCPSQNTVLYGVSGFITFSALFDANPDETSAANKLTDATFDVQFADLNDAPFGDYSGDVPIGLQSRVTGSFRFYFERGQPAQAFP